jgi:holin-like protein
MIALQGLALLLLLQTAGELIVRALGIGLPGPVLGLAMLLPALAWAPVARRVEAIASVLLQHLSLLFVPVGVGVIVHLGALAPLGWKLGVVIVVSTWVGMTVTALVLRALLGGRSGSADSDAHRPGVATTAPLPGKPTSPLGADRRHG